LYIWSTAGDVKIDTMSAGAEDFQSCAAAENLCIFGFQIT
jgi:hypothetical protein